MPTLEALHDNDKALNEMYQGDKSHLTPEDEAAYKALIEEQRVGHIATKVEVKDVNTGDQTVEVAHTVGNAALQNPYAVNSETWRTEKH